MAIDDIPMFFKLIAFSTFPIFLIFILSKQWFVSKCKDFLSAQIYIGTILILCGFFGIFYYKKLIQEKIDVIHDIGISISQDEASNVYIKQALLQSKTIHVLLLKIDKKYKNSSEYSESIKNLERLKLLENKNLRYTSESIKKNEEKLRETLSLLVALIGLFTLSLGGSLLSRGIAGRIEKNFKSECNKSSVKNQPAAFKILSKFIGKYSINFPNSKTSTKKTAAVDKTESRNID